MEVSGISLLPITFFALYFSKLTSYQDSFARLKVNNTNLSHFLNKVHAPDLTISPPFILVFFFIISHFL